MLRRFADPRLRAELDKTRDARDQARNTARRLFARLKATRHALETQAALTERWRGIARDAQDQLAAERARNQPADTGHYARPDGTCWSDCPVCTTEAQAFLTVLAAEPGRTQETAR